MRKKGVSLLVCTFYSVQLNQDSLRTRKPFFFHGRYKNLHRVILWHSASIYTYKNTHSVLKGSELQREHTGMLTLTCRCPLIPLRRTWLVITVFIFTGNTQQIPRHTLAHTRTHIHSIQNMSKQNINLIKCTLSWCNRKTQYFDQRNKNSFVSLHNITYNLRHKINYSTSQTTKGPKTYIENISIYSISS